MKKGVVAKKPAAAASGLAPKKAAGLTGSAAGGGAKADVSDIVTAFLKMEL